MAEVHKHILITGYVNEAPNEEYIPILENWFRELVEEIDMKILIEPKCVWCPTEGNEGITGLVCIETSHSSIHFWSNPIPHYKFDLYSCKDFSLDSIIKMLEKLGTYQFFYTVIDRSEESNPIIVKGGYVY